MDRRTAHWIVISNCQSFGLANCLTAAGRSVHADAMDIWTAARKVAEEPDHFMAYDFAILLPEVNQWPAFSDARLPPALTVPSFEFSGYSPDSIYMTADGDPLTGGPMGNYHSLIALAAFKEGLSVAETSARFTPALFDALGYFDQWEWQRRHVIEIFDLFSLDVRPVFTGWTERTPFMFTVDHPDIRVLYHLALQLLDRAGEERFPGQLMPSENLAQARWPVYPALAERFAVEGSYLFKPAHRPKPIELEEFVALSFECFARWDRSQLRSRPGDQPRLQRCRRLLGGEVA